MIDKSDQETQRLTPRLRFSLKQLEVFAAIARGGSARAAAAQLARSQSSASAALAELEGALGVHLFDRVAQRLVPNENARALLPGALSLLDQALELQTLFDREHPAPLRVTASLTIGEYVLPQLVASWQQTHPRNPIQLAIENTSRVIDAVLGQRADVGFIEGPQTHPGLVLRPWLTDELVVIAAPGHPLARSGRRASLKQLGDAAWILREIGSGTRQASDNWLGANLGSFQVAFELGSTEAIKRLTAAGAGLACLSSNAVRRDVQTGQLVILRTPMPAARRRLSIVMRREKRLGRATQDFVQHCKAMAQGEA